MKRCDLNPLITIKDITPTNDMFVVDCVFNPGVTKYNGQVILLLRVAESVKNDDSNLVKLPVVNPKTKEIEVVTLNKEENPTLNFSDSRQITNEKGETIYLTSLSHLRVARSDDGINFTIDKEPFLFPSEKEEAWGVEDARITQIENEYFINYTSVSNKGASTSLVKTKDFLTFERMGIIFPPENKDVSIFNRKIDGKYYAYHRPVPKAFGKPDIWIASSPDLIHWGNHEHLLGVASADCWENGRIGGGAPSIEIDEGWLHIYHAADRDDRYCLGAFLTKKEDPSIITHKTLKPLIEPEAIYEKFGFFGNVIFTCGLVREQDTLKVYYGAADDSICLVDFSIKEIITAMEEYNE